ncbi:signal peptidase I [Nocardioides sp. LML1-1-1.1]|uniref:signal peptidase I n=1 Tax=Nocardioides sp. LML1-1-1.1 TaxID=3135248 RepID=UPI0034362FBC
MALSVRATAGWIGQVLAWLVILGVVVVLAAAVLVPRLAGATPYTVLTGSMEPKYPPGTLVVVKPVAFDDIAIGDVITYQRESGKDDVVTHRVVGSGNRFDGKRVLTTQGDANQVADRNPVQEVQVRGRLWYSVPYLGYVNTALSGRQRQWAVWAVSAGLVGYAAYMFVGALRDRRRTRRAPTETSQDTESLRTTVPVAEPLEQPPVVSSTRTTPDRPDRTLVVVAVAGALLLVLVLVKIRTSRRPSS